MRKLLVYLKDYKKESVLGPLFKLLEASFELFVPLVIARIVDTGIDGGDYGYVWRMGGVLFLLAAIGLVCSVTAQYFAAKAATGFATSLRHSLFSHIQSLSFTEMDKLGTAAMITRMTSDINQVQSGVNLVLRLFLRSPFIVFGAMIMAFTIDVKAAFIFVVTIPLLSIVVFGIMLISIPLYKKVQAGLDRVLGRTRENLTGVRVIRAFNREDEEQEAFTRENQGLTRMQMFVGRFSACMNPVTYIIVNAATVVLIWTGAVRVDNGILTQGQVIALVNYMSQILVELVKLANLIITVTKAFACADRIAGVLELKSSLQETPAVSAVESGNAKDSGQSRPYIQYRHVNFSYKGAGADALTDIDFMVEKGQTVGIIGGTGSGKTSLVHLLPRFYDVSEGEVLIDGEDVRKYPLERLRAKIGIVMQKSVLFHGTVRDNLRWGIVEDTVSEDMAEQTDQTKEDARMWEALEIAQAKEFVEKKEGGLDFVIEQGGKNLSGGQRQRMTIARAVVRKPEILILDDSASALDFATDAALRKAIKNASEDMTVFIVSQRAASIMYADKILVLDDGKIAGQGTHEELLAGCEVYQEIYYSQFEKEG
ncbi:MAG: ABC transporter ATP-binding protein [Lachnospiraceae bacterium]|jgi:ABC-type multidrug transport system fused ATPase/permease subunit|nr:ABC transporter ATP-binding protein [Lachnospiraceae bacterium]